jgi:sugar phosphate isomerase/epimerase
MLKRIDASCTHAGLTFGIHNHYFKTKFAYESPADVLRALAGLSQTVGATVDVGQFASCGYDTVDAVRKLGPYLKLVHLKDIAAAGAEDNVPLGQGIAKIPEVMQELHKLNFGGLVAIEYEKEGPVEEDLRQEVAFARKLA